MAQPGLRPQWEGKERVEAYSNMLLIKSGLRRMGPVGQWYYV